MLGVFRRLRKLLEKSDRDLSSSGLSLFKRSANNSVSLGNTLYEYEYEC